MDLGLSIQLIFLCLLNIIFTFPGIVLNALVIVSILKSSQLKKKLCHFMIMVLSCCDLVSVLANHPGVLLCLTSWLTQDNYLLAKGRNDLHSSTALLAFSLLALFVMSIERYLGAYYPIFHRAAVTRSRLLTVLVILFIFQTALWVISRNDIVISETVHVIIVVVVTFPPLMFINFKLFKISRKGRRMNETSPEKRKKIDLKNTATCLLAVGCFALLSIPSSFYITFNIKTENKWTSKAILSSVWAVSTLTVNCTFNSLIFFWKNKVLRTEGIKTLKKLKDRLVIP